MAALVDATPEETISPGAALRLSEQKLVCGQDCAIRKLVPLNVLT